MRAWVAGYSEGAPRALWNVISDVAGGAIGGENLCSMSGVSCKSNAGAQQANQSRKANGKQGSHSFFFLE